MGKVMIINYSITQQGLENQLLNVVVGNSAPTLSASSKELVDGMVRAGAGACSAAALGVRTTTPPPCAVRQHGAAGQSSRSPCCADLASSTGNILDNEELIATLESAKLKSVEISAKLAESEITKVDINKTRAAYAPAAKRGSILFFAMASLSNIMKMYEISLASFLLVFKRALIGGAQGGHPAPRHWARTPLFPHCQPRRARRSTCACATWCTR